MCQGRLKMGFCGMGMYGSQQPMTRPWAKVSTVWPADWLRGSAGVPDLPEGT